MNKIILVDGNNLLFRSYYATAYNGNYMKNSKGFPTNALFGFTNMINKIVLEEKPEYMIVAFDKGKTFRHQKYTDYKGGRQETPDELKVQFPIAKELLTYMGIQYYEIDNYEADDIIGTFAKFCDEEEDFIGTIISSDKDLLQLISRDVDIKLLKQRDYIRYNLESFREAYGIEPREIIDLKALQGDASDNIPGVRGIGEKTALKLLQQYHTIDCLYEHIDEIKGKMKEKLEIDKENAYMSYELATIIRDVPVEITMEDVKIKPKDHKKLTDLYEDLEFFSFLKKEQQPEEELAKKELDVRIIKSIEEININEETAVYLELLGTNYHSAEMLGLGVYNKHNSLFIPMDILKKHPDFLTRVPLFTYDAKKLMVALTYQKIPVSNLVFDSMIAGYLLDYNVKDDIAYLANMFDTGIPFYEAIFGKTPRQMKVPTQDIIAYNAVLKAKFIYESKQQFEDKLKEEELYSLFEKIEMPLSEVLATMELNGVCLDQKCLREMGEEIQLKIELIEHDIYNDAGCEFNIASPKELGSILFEKLHLPHGKKNARGYSTSIDVLNKLVDQHPIIKRIMDYRMLTKLHSTYIEGLLNQVHEDGKIHTIYTQTLTRTGRLSSIEPNLQNIPIRYEYGRLIRKAFVPSENSMILGGDYSQIELRILAHMANVDALIEAFQNGMDIHTKTASDIFGVAPEYVTSEMRRIAKAVNFGIVYGISSFGLSENLQMSVGEAKSFIDNYLVTYPGIDQYMKEVIALAHKDGYVRTLFHRKRNIPELKNKNYMIRQQGERIALNTPIQGTSADIIKKAMIEIHQYLKEHNLKCKMILQVHDELLFDCPKDEVDVVMKAMKDIMEHTCELKVPLKVELASGGNWYQAK